MKKTRAILICLLIIGTCTCAKLPSNFKKCKNTDKDCLGKAVADALNQLDKPIPEVGLPTLDPLEIPSLNIGAGTGPVGLTQNFKNVKIFGFIKPKDVEFEIDLDKKTGKMSAIFPEIKLLADYDINGKILLLPVSGSGAATVILENLRGEATLTFEEYEKKGDKFLKIVDGALTLTPSLVKFNFVNLFNGDKALGDNINKVINENWKEVFDDVKSSYEDAFEQIFRKLFANVLAKVPISELFEE